MESFISLGRLHVPIFGIFAAVGLMCALALGLYTAVLARIDRDAFWDLSFLSIIGAFLISRIALVIENIPTFVHYPMAVLELPSLTASGLICALILSFWYLRRRRIPLLGALDAAAPCAALLLGFLSAGLFFDGTREGMPTTVPWAVGSSFGRVHPLEVYGAAAWFVLCCVLLIMLRREQVRGEVAGYALVLGGLANALLGFFRLPNVLYGTQMLDGQQWRGVEMVVTGSVLLAWRYAVSGRTAPGAREELPRAV